MLKLVNIILLIWSSAVYSDALNISLSGTASGFFTYSWQTGSWGTCGGSSPYWGSWSSCSKPCNSGYQTRSCYDTSGTQSRSVYCERSDSTVVSDSYCSGAGAKPTTSQSCYNSCTGSSSQSCNTQACVPTTCQSAQAFKVCSGTFYSHGWAASDPEANGANSFSSTWAACKAVCEGKQSDCVELIDYGEVSNGYNCLCHLGTGITTATGSFAEGNSSGWEVNSANCN